MIIIYLLIGFVGWCLFYGIATRTGRFDAEADDFYLGLIMSTFFWPVFIAAIIAFWIVVGLYVLVAPRCDPH